MRVGHYNGALIDSVQVARRLRKVIDFQYRREKLKDSLLKDDVMSKYVELLYIVNKGYLNFGGILNDLN